MTVLVIGLDETLEGEEGDDGNAYFSGDKKDVAIPPFQMELVRRILDTGRKVILLNMSGSDLDLSLPAEKADAVLQVWYPGAAGGEAVAKVLFGEVSPSGKLPVTFYRSCDDLPAFEDYSMRGRTYRYYDGTPVYPFGFGLTYGDCSVQDMYVVSVTDANTFTRGYTDRKSAFGERKATLSVMTAGRRTMSFRFISTTMNLKTRCRTRLFVPCGESILEKDKLKLYGSIFPNVPSHPSMPGGTV